MNRLNQKMWCNMGEMLDVEKAQLLLKRGVVNDEPVLEQQLLKRKLPKLKQRSLSVTGMEMMKYDDKDCTPKEPCRKWLLIYFENTALCETSHEKLPL